jgi:UDP-2-acetamido-2,6-beta-L-arabino-hexul-4-ose reductase
MYPIHENETGLFQELARSNDVKFGQISLLIINSGSSRGGHYHTRKEEWFCCIHGRCRLDLLDVHSKASKEMILDEMKREFIKVEPFWIHTLTNLCNARSCNLIIVVSEEFNESDPDTFKSEQEW